MTEEQTLDLSRQLTKAELAKLEEEERLIRLYEMRTSIEPRYTTDDQARELDVSVSTIKRMAKSEGFQQVVAKLAPKTRSPRLDVAQEYITEELLPLALRAVREILADPNSATTARMSAADKVHDWAFAGHTRVGEDQRRDAMEFLKQQGLAASNIQVIINNIGIAPPEYLSGLRAILPEVIEGEVLAA